MSKTITYAHGDSHSIPNAVIEVGRCTRSSNLGNTEYEVRVVLNRGLLGATIDGGRKRGLQAGDRLSLPVPANTEMIEAVRREFGRYGWREITPPDTWWDGQLQVSPIA